MQKDKRVVITGLGVVAPNGTGTSEFSKALFEMKSGIEYYQYLDELRFGCSIGGKPLVSDEHKNKYLNSLYQKILDNDGLIYAMLAGLEAWEDAGLEVNKETEDQSSGMVFGAGSLSMGEFLNERLVHISTGYVKKLGSRTIVQCMNSGGAAFLSGELGLGNRIISNSSACSTGTEALILGYEHIMAGKATRMLCGSTEASGMNIWGAFDAMRVTCRDSNDKPAHGSRPMSADSAGFVPGSGSGALVIETLEEAEKRGAKIYAEILGGEINSGGQRQGGSMTIPNDRAVQTCIRKAVEYSKIDPKEIDLISGHLTSTMADPIEIKNWVEALKLSGAEMPYINATKSLIGHCIAAAGAIELVGCVLQMNEGFIHGNLNAKERHPEIKKIIPADKIPLKSIKKDISVIAKANFGFGDVNSCVILKKWKK